MSELFLSVVNMSISASWIVLAILLLRLILKRAPRWTCVLLWGIVAVRLICPFTFESAVSLIPSAETISPEIMLDKTPVIHTGIPAINNAINPVIIGSFAPDPAASANPLQILIPILSAVWIAGIVILLAYTAISYFRIKRRTATAVLLCDNIYQSETVASPFVLGMIRPRIYLPFGISERDAKQVIAHERAHIRRRDYLWKPAGFLILTLHWFNPLMWLGYILLCRDIELACDEKVIREMDTEMRADYSEALLSCSVKRRMITACPLAFGEVGVKARVKSVLSYKKPAFWVIIAAIAASIAVAVCFLTSPKTPKSENGIVPDADGLYTDYAGVYITVESVETYFDDGHKIISIVWHNDTILDIAYGEWYTIEIKDGDEWKSVSAEDIEFPDIAILLAPNSAQAKSYSTEKFDLSEHGTYRLRSEFSPGDGKQYNTWVEFEVKPLESLLGSGGVDDSVYVYTESEIERLKSKFPMYFDLDGMKGLEVCVWQMAPNSYSCGLLQGKNVGYSNEEIWNLHTSSATLGEMKAIITHYILSGEVTKDKVLIHSVCMPFSSYAYIADDAYMQNLSEMFWAGIPSAPLLEGTGILDTAIFDIDGDGKAEQCTIRFGPTSGLFTFILSAYEEGRLEYFNIFQSPPMNLSFKVKAGGQVILEGSDGDSAVYIPVHVENGNIVVSSDDVDIGYWGEQGVDSRYAPKS